MNKIQLVACFYIALNLRMDFHFQSIVKKKRGGGGKRKGGKEKEEYATEIVYVL